MRGLAHRVIEVTSAGEWYPATGNGRLLRDSRLTCLISERCLASKQYLFWNLACRFPSLGDSLPC
jgi:hypothetical protein